MHENANKFEILEFYRIILCGLAGLVSSLKVLVKETSKSTHPPSLL
jgi:hypothetical protein